MQINFLKNYGFKKVMDNEKEIKYQYIDFLTEHTIKIIKTGKIVFSYKNDNDSTVVGLGTLELQAINKKCEEFGGVYE